MTGPGCTVMRNLINTRTHVIVVPLTAMPIPLDCSIVYFLVRGNLLLSCPFDCSVLCLIQIRERRWRLLLSTYASRFMYRWCLKQCGQLTCICTSRYTHSEGVRSGSNLINSTRQMRLPIRPWSGGQEEESIVSRNCLPIYLGQCCTSPMPRVVVWINMIDEVGGRLHRKQRARKSYILR